MKVFRDVKLILYPIAIFLVLTGSMSCVGYRIHTHSTYKPVREWDFIDSYLKVKERGNELSAEAQKRHQGRILEEDHHLVSYTNLVVKDIVSAYNTLISSHDLNPDQGKINYLLLRSVPPTEIKIIIIALDEPFAMAYPNGDIHISRSLIDTDSPFGAKNKAQLKALLAHEIIHLAAGHVVYQWVNLDANNRLLYQRVISNLSKLSTWLPIFSYSFDFDTPIELTKGGVTDDLIEHIADFGVIYLLSKMGDSPTEYLDVLRRVRSFGEKHKYDNRGPVFGIQNRIECLERMLSPGLYDFGFNILLKGSRLPKGITIFPYNIDTTNTTTPEYRLAKAATYWGCVLTKFYKKYNKLYYHVIQSGFEMPTELGIFPLFDYLFYYDFDFFLELKKLSEGETK